jgi:hypothetical protein
VLALRVVSEVQAAALGSAAAAATIAKVRLTIQKEPDYLEKDRRMPTVLAA